MKLSAPIVKTQMLIRKPVEDVFEAFVNPAITAKFWFTKSSGRLEAGRQVRWEWEMYGVSAEVHVKAIERPSRILIEWNDPPLPVEWLFTSRPDKTTLVTISNWGFRGSDDEVVKQVSIRWEDSRFFWQDSRRCWSTMSRSIS